jgi:hypothetical protein
MAWQALRERYGNRDESRVDRGNLFAPGHLTYPADGELLPKLLPRAWPVTDAIGQAWNIDPAGRHPWTMCPCLRIRRFGFESLRARHRIPRSQR